MWVFPFFADWNTRSTFLRGLEKLPRVCIAQSIILKKFRANFPSFCHNSNVGKSIINSLPPFNCMFFNMTQRVFDNFSPTHSLSLALTLSRGSKPLYPASHTSHYFRNPSEVLRELNGTVFPLWFKLRDEGMPCNLESRNTFSGLLGRLMNSVSPAESDTICEYVYVHATFPPGSIVHMRGSPGISGAFAKIFY